MASKHGQKCPTFVYRRRHFHFLSVHPPRHNTVYIVFSKGTEISNNILKSNKNKSKVHRGYTHLREATQTLSCSAGNFPCVFSVCVCVWAGWHVCVNCKCFQHLLFLIDDGNVGK